MQKALVVMAVGSVNEKTIIINPDEAGRFRYETKEKGLHFLNFLGARHLQQKIVLFIDQRREIKLNVSLFPPVIQTDGQGRFRHETHDKGLHFLNFAGVNHQQQKVILYIDEAREVKLNVRVAPEQYADDLAQAEIRGPNAKSPFNGTRLGKQKDGTYAAEFPSKDSVVQYLILKGTRSGEPVPGTSAGDYLIEPYGGIFAVIYGMQEPQDGKVKIVLSPENPPGNYVEKSPFSDDGSVDVQLTEIFQGDK